MIIFILLLLLAVCIFINYWSITKKDHIGYHVIDMFTDEEVKHVLNLSSQKKYDDIYTYITTHPRVLLKIQNVLGPEYIFKKYFLSIEKSSVSTCHRDENGQIFNSHQKFPSYTILFYFRQLNGCLEVVENSHRQDKMINFKKLKTIECTPGQAILFDADMIHSGTNNAGDENTTRIQLKLHHREDPFPEYLENMKQSLDASKNSGSTAGFMRFLSCTFPIIGDITRNGKNIPDFIVRMYKDITYGKGKYETNSY